MAKDKLFRLIHSLSAAEKKYFSQMNQSGKKEEAVYLQLFESISGKSEYDEKALKKEFPRSAANFHKLKAYLYEKILENLKQMQWRENSVLKTHEWMSWGELLKDKKMLDEAMQQADQLIEHCSARESFSQLGSSYYLKMILHQNKQQYAQALELIQKEREAIKLKENLLFYKELELSYYLMKNQGKQFVDGKSSDDRLHEFMQHPYLNDVQHAHSEIARVIYFEMRYEHFSRYPDKIQLAIEAAEKSLELMNRNDRTQKRFVLKYMSVLRNLSLFYTYTQQYKKAEKCIRLLNEFCAVEKLEEAFKLHYLFYMRLYLSMESKQHRLADKWINQYRKEVSEASLEEHEQHFNINYLLIVNYYCLTQKFGLAADYLQVLIRSKVIESIFPSYHAQYKLMLIICQYELGNIKLLDALVRTAEYNFSKKNIYHKLEKKLINYFKRYLYNPQKEKILFTEFLKSLDELRSNPLERNGLAMLENIGWLHWRQEKLKI